MRFRSILRLQAPHPLRAHTWSTKRCILYPRVTNQVGSPCFLLLLPPLYKLCYLTVLLSLAPSDSPFLFAIFGSGCIIPFLDNSNKFSIGIILYNLRIYIIKSLINCQHALVVTMPTIRLSVPSTLYPKHRWAKF